LKIISLLISLVLLTLSICFSAQAGDFAKREIHGFSVDGGLFAFEEYGVQDGSGFPYSNIYVVDTATDQWTAGSPYRIRLDDETKTVFDAREKARILAGTAMKSFENRGNVVATNRATELGIDDKRMIANPRLVVPPIDDAIEFRLEEIPFAGTETCEAFGATKGFRLLKIGTRDGDETIMLHEDTSVPESRNCPLGYALADLVTYYPEGKSPVFAVLIRMQTVGFEGPDGRYLAVTGRF
jgi:predicted secreted protein